VSGSDLVAGLHAVRTALAHGAGEVSELWYDPRRRDRRLREVLDLARAGRVATHALERAELNRLTRGANHQGVAARVAVPGALDELALDGLLEGLPEPPFLLVLDGVQDPHNLGACLRTADATGVHAVIAPRDRSVGLTPVVCKVASGAAGRVPYVQVTNLVRTLKRLQGCGVWLVGTAGEAPSDLYSADLRGPLALVMGGEGKGLRRLTREHCDLLLSLPLRGVVESLNVSVATGIVLYEALRQRRDLQSPNAVG
jgi:23S rRNA (guanosine2251-2'-O)-methyltransferase